MNIVLVGFMGTGKSTYGKILATKLGMGFVDTDQTIEQRTGKKVSHIFQEHSEEYFRSLEHDVVLDVSTLDNHVIATGGGVITHAPSLDILKRNGIVIGLIPTNEILLQRLKERKDRPLIADKTDAQILELYAKRLTYHFQCDANLEIQTQDKRSIVEMLARTVESLKQG